MSPPVAAELPEHVLIRSGIKARPVRFRGGLRPVQKNRRTTRKPATTVTTGNWWSVRTASLGNV
jgi:hypothetical protein